MMNILAYVVFYEMIRQCRDAYLNRSASKGMTPPPPADTDTEDTYIDDFEPLPPLNLRQGLEGFFLLGSLDP